MTPTEMRFAAALTAGWKLAPSPSLNIYEKNGKYEPIPLYDTSLDEIAVLIATITTEEEQGEFNDHLERIVERDLKGAKQERFYFDIINATAVQRLEAYLRTTTLYKE